MKNVKIKVFNKIIIKLDDIICKTNKFKTKFLQIKIFIDLKSLSSYLLKWYFLKMEVLIPSNRLETWVNIIDGATNMTR